MRRRRREARSRAIDWKKAPWAVLLAGGAVFVGWLAVKAAAVDALVRRNPFAAAGFAPDSPRIPLRYAMIEFQQRSGRISPGVARAAIGSLQHAPLVEEPFLIAALNSLVERDQSRADSLLREARRRNPRDQVTRILLLDGHLRTGRVQEAASEIAAISRLVPGTSTVLTPQLAKFAAEPKTRASLAAVLRSDPSLRDMLLEHLARTSADSELILELAGPLSAAPPPEPPIWQPLLLNSLVKEGKVERAQSLWGRFAGVQPRDAARPVYDGAFRGLPGSPPFNWQFVSSPAGVAEPSRNSGLQVDYYGRVDAELASQLLALKPGRYRLAFQAAGDVPERGSSLAWIVICHPGTAAIATIPISNISYAAKGISGEFVVPASGCPAQWLRLMGTAAEFPTALNATISNLQVQSAGAS